MPFLIQRQPFMPIAIVTAQDNAASIAISEGVLRQANRIELNKELAEAAKAAGVTTVVFDRGGFLFHGRVKALADAAREGGLQF